MANPNPNQAGLRRGGGASRRGIPNRSTRRMKAFLDGVFDEAFETPEFRQRLVASIVNLTIEPRLLQLLLNYWVGRPSQVVDVTHGGTVSLAAIIAGRIEDEIGDADEDAEDDPRPEGRSNGSGSDVQ